MVVVQAKIRTLENLYKKQKRVTCEAVNKDCALSLYQPRFEGEWPFEIDHSKKRHLEMVSFSFNRRSKPTNPIPEEQYIKSLISAFDLIFENELQTYRIVFDTHEHEILMGKRVMNQYVLVEYIWLWIAWFSLTLMKVIDYIQAQLYKTKIDLFFSFKNYFGYYTFTLALHFVCIAYYPVDGYPLALVLSSNLGNFQLIIMISALVKIFKLRNQADSPYKKFMEIGWNREIFRLNLIFIVVCFAYPPAVLVSPMMFLLSVGYDTLMIQSKRESLISVVLRAFKFAATSVCYTIIIYFTLIIKLSRYFTRRNNIFETLRIVNFAASACYFVMAIYHYSFIKGKKFEKTSNLKREAANKLNLSSFMNDSDNSLGGFGSMMVDDNSLICSSTASTGNNFMEDFIFGGDNLDLLDERRTLRIERPSFMMRFKMNSLRKRRPTRGQSFDFGNKNKEKSRLETRLERSLQRKKNNFRDKVLSISREVNQFSLFFWEGLLISGVYTLLKSPDCLILRYSQSESTLLMKNIVDNKQAESTNPKKLIKRKFVKGWMFLISSYKRYKNLMVFDAQNPEIDQEDPENDLNIKSNQGYRTLLIKKVIKQKEEDCRLIGLFSQEKRTKQLKVRLLDLRSRKVLLNGLSKETLTSKHSFMITSIIKEQLIQTDQSFHLRLLIKKDCSLSVLALVDSKKQKWAHPDFCTSVFTFRRRDCCKRTQKSDFEVERRQPTPQPQPSQTAPKMACLSQFHSADICCSFFCSEHTNYMVEFSQDGRFYALLFNCKMGFFCYPLIKQKFYIFQLEKGKRESKFERFCRKMNFLRNYDEEEEQPFTGSMEADSEHYTVYNEYTRLIRRNFGDEYVHKFGFYSEELVYMFSQKRLILINWRTEVIHWIYNLNPTITSLIVNNDPTDSYFTFTFLRTVKQKGRITYLVRSEKTGALLNKREGESSAVSDDDLSLQVFVDNSEYLIFAINFEKLSISS